jgi:uncharacterized protein YjiK
MKLMPLSLQYPRFWPTLVCLFALCLGCSLQCKSQAGRPGTPASSDTSVYVLPYDLENPNHIITLVSEELKEISGLSPTESDDIFCAIADERGEVFFVDCKGGGAISRKVLFREKGDFEGVEMVGKTLYAVKSDGDIFEVKHWDNPAKMSVENYKTPLKKEDDVEGLAYDKNRNALLLACKSDPSNAAPRHVFAFSLKEKLLSEKPVYTIDPETVNNLLPYNSEDKNNFFSPSGIAVHPISGDLFVISTSLKRLVVLDHQSGNIRKVVRLDKKLLPQPEGISFDKAGNLYLSSEGKKGEGSILRFNFLPK